MDGSKLELELQVDSKLSDECDVDGFCRNRCCSVDEFVLPTSALAVVHDLGGVMWIPPMRLTARCNIDLTDYPFDTQTCSFKFASWTYDGYKLDISFYNDREEVIG